MNEYFVLLQNNRNYRFLWLGNVVSQLGDWFNLLASATLITELSGSGVAISYLFLARFLPLFFFSPIAGILADRYSRKWLMISADILRGAVVLGFLFIRNPEQVWLLYVLTVLQFCLSAIFIPAKSAVVANIVDKKDLVTANALDSLTWSTMFAAGAFLGGVITAVFGKDTAFIMDAGTFLLSAILIGFVMVPKRTNKIVSKGQGGWLDFMDGFRYLKAQPFILIIALVKALGSLVYGAQNVFEIGFAEEVYPFMNNRFTEFFQIEDGGTATLGLIYVISGLGTGLGPLFFRRRLGDAIPRLLLGLTIGFGLMAVGLLFLSTIENFAYFSLLTFIRTIGSGVIWVFSAALLQLLVPDEFRGRVFAFEFACLTLTQSISVLVAGVMQDSWGWSIQQGATVMGAFGIFLFVPWLSVYFKYLKPKSERIQLPS